MLLSIFYGLIVNLAFVYGECDVGTGVVDDFDFCEATGTWYVTLHSPDPLDDSLACVVMNYEPPIGNTSYFTKRGLNTREKTWIQVSGNATHWDGTGFEEVYPQDIPWAGRYYVIAVDYGRYAILKHCPPNSNQPIVYVAYRYENPDDETKEEVEQELEKNNIDVNELREWWTVDCTQAESSTESESSTETTV